MATRSRRSRKERKGKGFKGSLIALVGYDPALAESYLRARFGRSFVELKLPSSQGELSSRMSSICDELLRPSLFELKPLLLRISSLPASLKRNPERLVRCLTASLNSGRLVVLWMVSDRWQFKADNLGEKLYEFIRKNAELVVLESPRKRLSSLDRLERLLELKGLELSEEQKLILLETVGDDVTALEGVIDKLLVYGVEVDDFEGFVRSLKDGLRTGLPSPFEFVEAFLSGDKASTLRYLKTMKDKGVDMASYIQLIISQLELAVKVKSLLNYGYGLSEIASELKAHRYRVMKVKEMLDSTQLNEVELILLLRQLADIEVAVKTGKGNYHDLMMAIL